MASAILLDNTASITKLAELQDKISNTLSANQGRWGFEFKVFRANPASASPADGQQQQSSESGSNFLYTLSFAHYPGELFSLTKGSGSVLQGDFDAMLSTKLQSLWIPRQSYKGDGTSYNVDGGDFTLRVANLTLLGNYKGLVIEIMYTNENGNGNNALEKVNSMLQSLDLPTVSKVTTGKMETAWQYVECLTK